MKPEETVSALWRLFDQGRFEDARPLLADAFAAVSFPVLPVVQADGAGRYRFYPRNSRLFAPRDFDYSPYFDIIKYPIVAFEEGGHYRSLPWAHGIVCNDESDCVPMQAEDDPAAPLDGSAA